MTQDAANRSERKPGDIVGAKLRPDLAIPPIPPDKWQQAEQEALAAGFVFDQTMPDAAELSPSSAPISVSPEQFGVMESSGGITLDRKSREKIASALGQYGYLSRNLPKAAPTEKVLRLLRLVAKRASDLDIVLAEFSKGRLPLIVDASDTDAKALARHEARHFLTRSKRLATGGHRQMLADVERLKVQVRDLAHHAERAVSDFQDEKRGAGKPGDEAFGRLRWQLGGIYSACGGRQSITYVDDVGGGESHFRGKWLDFFCAATVPLPSGLRLPRDTLGARLRRSSAVAKKARSRKPRA